MIKVNIVNDKFNGNIKDPVRLYKELWAVSAIMYCLSFYSLYLVLTYDKVENDARLFMIGMSVFNFIVFAAYPFVTIYVVKRTSRYPRLARLLVRPERFTGS